MKFPAIKTDILPPLDWFTFFVVALVLLPLPFGGNRPWASDMFAVLCSFLLIELAWNLYHNPKIWPSDGPVHQLKFSMALIGLVTIWSFVQVQSWTPESWHHPIWQSVKDFPEAFKGSISIDPDEHAESLAHLLSYIACFLLAFVGGRDNNRAQQLLKALAGAAVVYALYGLMMQSTGVRKILWFNKWAYEGSVTSTFVNKNSYATYAGLGLQIWLALLWKNLKHKLDKIPHQKHQKVLWLEKLIRQNSLLFVMSLIVLGALLLSGSRAGLVSSLAGCLVLLLMLAVNRRWRWTRWLPILSMGVLFLSALALVSDVGFFEQFNDHLVNTDVPLRLAGYKASLHAIADRPWLGYGMGSFEDAFRFYRTPDILEWFQHAHNDYLEMAIELGVPAALLLLTAILAMVARCYNGAQIRRRNEIFPILALSASVTVGLHACVDFSMQIPAIAGTYAALLGLGVAQSWSSRDTKRR